MSDEEVVQMVVSKRHAAESAIGTYMKVAAAANDRLPAEDDTDEAVATDESTEDRESS